MALAHHPESESDTSAGWSPAVPSVASGSLAALAVFGLFYTLHFARKILVPIALAVLMHLLLSGAVRRLRSWHVPPVIGAALVLLGLMGVSTLLVTLLSGSFQYWVRQAPQVIHDFRVALSEELALGGLLETARQATRPPAAAPGPTPVEVEITGSTGQAIVVGTGEFLVTALFVVFLAYFMLAAVGDLRARLLAILPTRSRRRQVLLVATEIEHSVASYLGVITVINLGLGLAVGLAMWAVGLPNPAFWGAVAGIFNYIPYLGPLATATLIGLAAFSQAHSLAALAAAVGLYLAINSTEAFLVTPSALGQRFRLSPVAVLVSLVFWGWLWGLAGAVLAIPILVTLHVLCEHVGTLRPLGVLLSRGYRPPAGTGGAAGAAGRS